MAAKRLAQIVLLGESPAELTEGMAGEVFLVLAPILLVLAAALCVWRRSSRWPYVLSACVATAAAGWQIAMMVISVDGRSWDPVLHGLKVGVLVLVVGVDLAAAVVALRAMSRRPAIDQDGQGRSRWLSGTLVLLVSAAILYLATMYVLATSGN